jgi:drug/metabolite transporter (DMT)-like permease
MNIYTVLFLRFGVSASFMTVILLLRREHFPRGQILAQLVGMGALGYVGQSFMYMTAIKYASAGLVALLLYLYPFFVAILATTFLHEKITRIKVITAALIYSIYIIVGTNVMKHVSPVQSSTVIFASAGAVFGLLTLAKGAHFPASNTGWLAMLGIIIISTIIPVVTFLAGLERIGPTNAAMLSTLEPVVTVLLAAWLFGDKLLPIVMLGGGLILISVMMLTRSEIRSA